MTAPTLDQQERFWDGWNRQWRHGEMDSFMARQAHVAGAVARSHGLKGARILDVGCGTGWLGAQLAEFGKVTGVDLSPDSIAAGRARHPEVELICGDFLAVDLAGPYDLIVSADSFAHVYDQRRFVERIAGLLAPGGTFLLMTQNAFVWNRRSRLVPTGPGQIQSWPPLGELRSLLAPHFRVRRISSLVPGGDRGVLWWVENRYLRGCLRRARLLGPWDRALERARLGRELVIESVRSDPSP